jgi:hypothetical protein
MVLVQIYVTAALNNTYINVPLFGTYDVNILNVTYHDSPALARPMAINSDIIRFPNSHIPFLTFINAPSSSTTYNAGIEKMLSIPGCTFNGKVLINLLDITTGVQPVGMQYLLISMEVVKCY